MVAINRSADTIYNLTAIVPYSGIHPWSYCFFSREARYFSSIKLAPGDSIQFTYTHPLERIGPDTILSNYSISSSLRVAMANNNLVEVQGQSQVLLPLNQTEYQSHEPQISFFPNPVKDHLYLRYSGLKASRQLRLTLYATDGKRVFDTQLSLNEEGVTGLSLPDLPKGMYHLHVQDIKGSHQIHLLQLE